MCITGEREGALFDSSSLQGGRSPFSCLSSYLFGGKRGEKVGALEKKGWHRRLRAGGDQKRRHNVRYSSLEKKRSEESTSKGDDRRREESEFHLFNSVLRVLASTCVSKEEREGERKVTLGKKRKKERGFLGNKFEKEE